MNVRHDVLEHKTLMIAFPVTARASASKLGVDMTMSVAQISRELGANRSSVYEQGARLVGPLTELVSAGPGRPAAGSDGERDSEWDGRCSVAGL